MFHDFVQDTILAHHPEAKAEVLVETEDFKGYADLVLGNEVVDLKTQHSRAFWYRDGKPWDVIKKEISTNILQVMFYASILGKDRARLVYISKDDLCIQEYDLAVNEAYLAEINQEVENLKTIWKENKLPPATPRVWGVDKKTGKPKECDYCSWKDLCIKIEKENKNADVNK
jgi:hypothetical protein